MPGETISPSAKWLLILKSRSGIPFAREAAEILWGAAGVEAAYQEISREAGFEPRRLHFENRYRSLDTLLAESGATRVLELAAGLSFRGLALAGRGEVFYADTDLPGMVETKRSVLSRLGPLPPNLLVEPLDALASGALKAMVARIPPGPLALLNEGLLIYLTAEEKARLAAGVREVLLARGGVWITGDVYVRSEIRLSVDERVRRFLEEHRVEEQKFADFGEAEAFFEGAGFRVERKLSPSQDPRHVRESWLLRPR